MNKRGYVIVKVYIIMFFQTGFHDQLVKKKIILIIKSLN